VRRNKIIGAIGVVAIAIALVGCSAGADAPSVSVKTLKLWMPPFGSTETADSALWADILAPFEEETGVKVETTIVPWETFEDKYLTGVAAGTGPDVGYMYSTMIGDYVTRGILEPFDKYLSDEDRANYLFLDKGLVNNEQYSMPIVVGGAKVLYYNKDILAQAGVEAPATWDEFVTASLAVKASGVTPLVQQWGAPAFGAMNATFAPFLYQAGGKFFSDDGTKTAFNSPEGVKAAEFLYSLKEQGILDPSTTGQDEAQATQQFLDGKAAFLISADGTFAKASDAGLNFGFVNSLEEKQQGTFVAADTLVMFKTCPDMKLCTKLTNFMLSGPSMEKFHTVLAYPPVAKDEAYAGIAEFKDLYSVHGDILIPLPVVVGGGPVYDVLYTNLQQMMLGKKTPMEALQDAANAGDAALAEK
jgi:multiple sugar transport system substrate-binding protein